MKNWYSGSGDEIVSMGVISDGTKYGIAKDLWFSVPCKTKDFKYEIIEGYDLSDDWIKPKIEATTKELM